MIEELFFLPPMAIARLGGSEHPLDSFTWIEDPGLHGAGATVISPAVTLQIMGNGEARPFLPSTIQFRDGALLRPVAPFFELWVRADGAEYPVTLAWLNKQGSTLHDLKYSIDATNAKAARRTGDAGCAFSAHVQSAGDDHERHDLLAFSAGLNPLVPASHPIPLGTFQVIRPQPAESMGVDLSVLRVRFTPAKGHVYGPPIARTAAEPDFNNRRRVHQLVSAANRILSPRTRWTRYDASDQFRNPEPSDTYDGSGDRRRRGQSFGVVDDTCDVILRAALRIKGKTWTAMARAFCAPPDFAPDRRPFVSLADDLIDRDPPKAGSRETLPDAVERLGDLFERIFETVSLTNLDMIRNAMLPRSGRGLANFADLPAVDRDSMTPKDKLFDRTNDLNSPPTSHEELPYSAVAQQVHAPFAAVDDLRLFLQTHAERVRHLIRPAYAHFADLHAHVAQNQKPDAMQRDARITRDTLHDMRMPPYMRDSDATPLSLNRRQYEFLMQILTRLQAHKTRDGTTSPPLTRTEAHVARVVARRASAGRRRSPHPKSRK